MAARSRQKGPQMARFIIIDTQTGYIFGDTADLTTAQYECSNRNDDADIVAACRAVDESIGSHGLSYRLESYNPSKSRDGYLVYRADVGGSDAVPTVTDGQDQETIEAVERDCDLVGFVTRESEEW